MEPNSVFCGDFNAHDPLWSKHDRTPSNHTGKSLRSAYESNLSFNLLTPKGLDSCLNISSGKYSTLDLMFGSGKFTTVDEVNVQNSLGADHNPVLYCFNYNQTSYDNKSPLTWNLKQIN